MFGSDGNLWPVADMLFGQSGVDAHYEVDTRAGMELRKVRDAFPHLTLFGVISSHTLDTGTKEDVEKEVLSCIEAAKEKGSIVVGCSNIIASTTPIENVKAMVETIRKYR